MLSSKYWFLGVSSSKFDESENPEDISMMVVEENDYIYHFLFIFMAKSDDYEHVEVTLLDNK